MIVDNTWGRKLKNRQEEINRLQLYFNEHVGNSWRKLKSKTARINTFTYHNIPAEDSLHNKLTTQLRDMRIYVNAQMDTLAHTSWPIELEESSTAVLTENFGLSADTV